MKKLDKEALLEGFKELIRTAILACIPLVISGLQAGTVDWRAVGIAGAIAFLSGLDKWGHEKGVETPLDLKPLDKLVK